MLQSAWAFSLPQARLSARVTRIPVLRACRELEDELAGWVLFAELLHQGELRCVSRLLPHQSEFPDAAQALLAQLREQAEVSEPGSLALYDLRGLDERGKVAERNQSCPCGSGLKAKRCPHLNGTPFYRQEMSIVPDARELVREGEESLLGELEAREPVMLMEATTLAGSALGVRVVAVLDRPGEELALEMSALVDTELRRRLPFLRKALLLPTPPSIQPESE